MNKPANYRQLEDLLTRMGFERLKDRAAISIYSLTSAGMIYALAPHKPSDPVRDSDWLSLTHQLEWRGVKLIASSRR